MSITPLHLLYRSRSEVASQQSRRRRKGRPNLRPSFDDLLKSSSSGAKPTKSGRSYRVPISGGLRISAGLKRRSTARPSPVKGNALGVANMGCSVVSVFNLRGTSLEVAMPVACAGLAISHARSQLEASERGRSRRFTHGLQASQMFCTICRSRIVSITSSITS